MEHTQTHLDEGACEGVFVGPDVGDGDGASVGDVLGPAVVGPADDAAEGAFVTGVADGERVGEIEGPDVGLGGRGCIA